MTITTKHKIETILDQLDDAISDRNIPLARELKADLAFLVDDCHAEAESIDEFHSLILESKEAVIKRTAQVQHFSHRLVRHIHVVVDQSKTISYKHRRKDNHGVIEVFPVMDLYEAIKYNSKIEAQEVADQYSLIRGHEVYAVTMLEALQADLSAQRAAVAVFTEHLNKL